MYLDANNLYGWIMGKYLPYSGFKWLKEKEIDEFDVNLIDENSPDGYILEVDLNYSDDIHELHNDYALAPGKVEISQNMLSKYCSNIADEYEIKIGDFNKLNLNLGNKNKYGIHYKNLQLYLSLGIKLTKIPRVLKFKQSDWLKKIHCF